VERPAVAQRQTVEMAEVEETQALPAGVLLQTAELEATVVMVQRVSP
jgi:hypothetical protein